MADYQLEGTEKVMRLELSSVGGLNMDDYKWDCKIFCNPRNVITISKDEMTRIDEKAYEFILDTDLIGPGEITCQLHVRIPDNRFSDGYRDEHILIPTGDRTYKKMV